MNNFKKIRIDKESERAIDFAEHDLIICQKTDDKGSSQLRAVILKVNSDTIEILALEEGDWSFQDIVRVGNEIDNERQSCIIISAEGTGAPYESMISDIDSFEAWDSGVGRDFHLGNLDYIKDERFPTMKGKGMLAHNVYLTGEFALSSGENVGTLLRANAKGIFQAVKKDDIISSINQTAESISIKANRIDIDGIVPSLKAKLIGVNKLNADNINVDELRARILTADSIKSKLVGADRLNASEINFDNATGSNVSLTGKINAIEGTFGAWLILKNKLLSKNGSTELYADGRILLNHPTTGQKIEITNQSLPAPPNVNDDIYVNTTASSSSPIKQNTNNSKEVEYVMYAAAQSSAIATNWTSNQANKKTFTIKSGIKINCTTQGLSGFAATLNLPGYNKEPSTFKVISISITTQLCRASDNVVVASKTSSSSNYVVHFTDSDFLGMHMWGSLGTVDLNNSNFEYISPSTQSYYIKSIFRVRGSFSNNYPHTYGLVGSITYHGALCSLEAGNLRSVIAPDGMRIAKSSGKYFQIDTKATTVADFVKTVWV